MTLDHMHKRDYGSYVIYTLGCVWEVLPNVTYLPDFAKVIENDGNFILNNFFVNKL